MPSEQERIEEILWGHVTSPDREGFMRTTRERMMQAAAEIAAPWQPIETAPRDGTRFWGKVDDDAIAMLWHQGFEAFVSTWRRMQMADGYTINGKPFEDHSPTTHRPTHWMPLPPAPGIEAEGRDAQRLGATPESPVPVGQAPDLIPSQDKERGDA